MQTLKVSTMSNQKLQLLLDIPEPEALFHFGEYARVLTNAIVNSKAQLTIGIWGAWGKGKSTLLEMIRLEIGKQKEEILVVPFDAWRFQHDIHMALPMLETLKEILEEHKGALQNLTGTIAKLTMALAHSVTVKVGAAEISPGHMLEEMQEETNSQYYQWHKSLSDALKQARSQSPQSRIVFLIDDLDRCLPDKAIQVLEAIKVMFDVEGFIFVLALDKSVLENAVEAHYGKDYGINGRDYIKKLVQVEFTLPALRQQDLQDYVTQL